MKKVLLAISFVLLLGGCFISCKKNCYCDAYRIETGQKKHASLWKAQEKYKFTPALSTILSSAIDT